MKHLVLTLALALTALNATADARTIDPDAHISVDALTCSFYGHTVFSGHTYFSTQLEHIHDAFRSGKLFLSAPQCDGKKISQMIKKSRWSYGFLPATIEVSPIDYTPFMDVLVTIDPEHYALQLRGRIRTDEPK